MPRVDMDLETDVAPEKVVAALIDFTDRRPDIWPGLSRKYYEVYTVGDTEAAIREGTSAPGMSVWARERYDWSTPGVVRWTVLDSNFSAPGSYVEARISPREGGGSNVHLTWDREPTTFKAKLMMKMIVGSGGKPVKSSFMKGMASVE